MFRKKTTPWVMVVTMLGMMGAIEAQTIDKNWVRQNANSSRQARSAIRFANSSVKWYENFNQPDSFGDPGGSFFKGSAIYKDPYINAAEAVGAPHVDVVSSPTAPRTRETCWETAAWIKTGNNDDMFAKAVLQEIDKQGLPQLNMLPGFEESLYIENACVNPRP